MIDEGKKIDFDKVVTFNKEKDIFIYSLEILIKIILLKSNYILNNESIFSFNNQNNLKKLKYPMIKTGDSDMNFIEAINSFLSNADSPEFSEENFNSLILMK